MQGAVGLPVAAAVESVPCGLAGRGRDRTGAAQRCERGLAAQPVRVVAGGDQQLCGGDGADALVACSAGAVCLTRSSSAMSSWSISTVSCS